MDAAIKAVAGKLKDDTIACIFANALPNTLDTTVHVFTPSSKDAPSDALVITGYSVAACRRVLTVC